MLFYGGFNSTLSHVFSLNLKQDSFLSFLAHLAVISLLFHPSFTATFFLFFHLSFLPSGSLSWCNASCKSQGYMWYRVGGGGPGVLALWQRQQVHQLLDVCLYPWICPLDTSHFLPKYISLSLNHPMFSPPPPPLCLYSLLPNLLSSLT